MDQFNRLVAEVEKLLFQLKRERRINRLLWKRFKEEEKQRQELELKNLNLIEEWAILKIKTENLKKEVEATLKEN